MPKREPPADPHEQIQARIPRSVATEVRRRLRDPIARKTRYGALSELVEQLLRQWLKEQEANG